MAAHIWHQLNPLGGGWLPEHVTVRGRKQEARGVLGGLVVSECWRAGGEEGESLWVASADGKGVGLEEEVLAAAKAKGEGGEEVERAYELMAVVSFIASGGRTAPESQGTRYVVGWWWGCVAYRCLTITPFPQHTHNTRHTTDGHLVLHVKVPAPEAANATTTAAGAEAPWQWFILNDFLVEPTIVEDALGFLPSWKEPCVLLYRARDSAAGTNQQWAQLLAAASSVGDPGAPRSRIPPAVFESPSLSSGAPGPRTFTPLPADKLPVRFGGGLICVYVYACMLTCAHTATQPQPKPNQIRARATWWASTRSSWRWRWRRPACGRTARASCPRRGGRPWRG